MAEKGIRSVVEQNGKVMGNHVHALSYCKSYAWKTIVCYHKCSYFSQTVNLFPQVILFTEIRMWKASATTETAEKISHKILSHKYTWRLLHDSINASM